MAEKKKSSGLTEAEKEKARAQMQREKEKRARKREKEQKKAARNAERWEKAAAEERERAAKERAKQEALENDPEYQAKKAAEAERMKERGRREMEKARERSAKKAAAAAKSKEKIASQEKLEMKPSRGGKTGSAAGSAAGLAAARSASRSKGGKVKRSKGNVVALVVIVAVAIAAAILIYPPQDKITQGLDIQGGVSVNLHATAADGSNVTQEQMDEAQRVITSRVNASGASAASVQQQGSNSFLVQVPGAEDSQAIIDTLSSQGVLEFVRVDAIDDEGVVSLLESGITGMNLIDEGVPYTSFMTGDNVSNVTTSRPDGSAYYAVDLNLDSAGTSEFAAVTSELVANHGKIAIVLDGVVECAPAVQSVIATGQVQITGNYTAQQAQDLKAIINSGSLPVSLTIDQSSIVGPTLGQSALWVGVISALIGLALVIVWLLLFYNGLGLLTGISVIIMAAVYLGLLALLSYFGWFSLTLPGIAGIIVNIGLSADSSILILECFHEQVRKGRSVRAAAKDGVHEGIMTSLDADVVTLVSALVLYFVAIGDVRGFGLTLALGIICDLIVMALFSGPVIRLLGNTAIAKHPGFWGMRDDINEGEYIAKEVM